MDRRSFIVGTGAVAASISVPTMAMASRKKLICLIHHDRMNYEEFKSIVQEMRSQEILTRIRVSVEKGWFSIPHEAALVDQWEVIYSPSGERHLMKDRGMCVPRIIDPIKESIVLQSYNVDGLNHLDPRFEFIETTNV